MDLTTLGKSNFLTTEKKVWDIPLYKYQRYSNKYI